MSEHELITRYWQACEDRDWTSFGSTVAAEVVYRCPQTRELVRGRDDYLAFNRTYPGDWHLTVERLVTAPGQAVSWTRFRVGAEEMTGLCFFTVADDLITEIDDFWPESYEPVARAVDVVQRY